MERRNPEGHPNGRDRARTEARLLEAARSLIERDGVLGGISLHEVAEESSVNRGQIYQYFGSRRELLRAALRQSSWWPGRAGVGWDDIFRLPFLQRRSRLFGLAIQFSTFIKLATLLVLDGDPEAVVFPAAPRQIRRVQADQQRGDLREDVDPTAAHIMTVATYLGYCVFREQFAREFGVDPETLDRRAEVAYVHMLSGLAPGTGEGTDHVPHNARAQTRGKE